MISGMEGALIDSKSIDKKVGLTGVQKGRTERY